MIDPHTGEWFEDPSRVLEPPKVRLGDVVGALAYVARGVWVILEGEAGVAGHDRGVFPLPTAELRRIVRALSEFKRGRINRAAFAKRLGPRLYMSLRLAETGRGSGRPRLHVVNPDVVSALHESFVNALEAAGTRTTVWGSPAERLNRALRGHISRHAIGPDRDRLLRFYAFRVYRERDFYVQARAWSAGVRTAIRPKDPKDHREHEQLEAILRWELEVLWNSLVYIPTVRFCWRLHKRSPKLARLFETLVEEDPSRNPNPNRKAWAGLAADYHARLKVE